jgi:hypothetical protein
VAGRHVPGTRIEPTDRTQRALEASSTISWVERDDTIDGIADDGRDRNAPPLGLGTQSSHLVRREGYLCSLHGRDDIRCTVLISAVMRA